jgi:hypothetical protein
VKDSKVVTEFQKALHTLCEFFKLRPDVFNYFSSQAVIEWAARVKDPKYELSLQEHTFLIGRGKAW